MERETYHGITAIACEQCGHSTNDVRVMELWNDEWGQCPECGSSKAIFRLEDGGLARYDDIGDITYEVTVELTVEGFRPSCTCGFVGDPVDAPGGDAAVAHAMAVHGLPGA